MRPETELVDGAPRACPLCGAEAEAGARFCPGCGQRLPAAEAAVVPPTRHLPGRRTVLVFLGIVAACGLVFVLGMIYFIRHTTIVTSNRNGGRVESPFGVVTANNDPAQLAHGLGLEVYPRAVGERGAQLQLAGSTIVSLSFRTAAPPRAVIGFYHVRYPDADVKTLGSQISLVQVGLRDTLTIKAAPQDGHTEIDVSDVQR